MAKRAKGLTFDQKREKMLTIFHSTKDVFNFQQVQKLSIKAGISFPSVKQVLMSLLADDLVNGDKIGAGNFYWSFPSRTQQVLINRSTETKAKVQKLSQTKANLLKELEEAQIGRQKTEEREKLEEKLKEMKEKRNIMKKNMEKYERFDPERIQLLGGDLNYLEKQDKEVKKVADFWTDNIFQILKYLKKEFQMKDDEIKMRFEIDPEIDYLD